MLKSEIERLQNILNDAIEGEQDDELIYDLSTQLDELIVSYYREMELKVS
ncbi:MAG: Spo0E family sporulation regulatory protein-aspartic acid phosphatase [Candidatus Alkaliphilus sp. MAG34]|nr:Spo0E family sporulation regulatory protein-aspartic acid phosphatase [Clostridiales bacterium]